ncbi:MAG: Rieske (2Fe-2S) protein [Vicinamibacterales bacterium]
MNSELPYASPALQPPIAGPGRRSFLRVAFSMLSGGLAAVASVVATGATAATVLTKAAVGRSLVPRAPQWIRAGRLDELETDIPTPVTLRITRHDGYLETVDQQVVFIVRSAAQEVRAMSSSCAHLGCSVSFNRERQQFLCPCHNGVFNLDGSVAAGPPPKPLEQLPVKVDKARILVEV